MGPCTGTVWDWGISLLNSGTWTVLDFSFNNNLFKTSENGRCITCDFLSFDYNIYEELTAVMLFGYPGAKHLSFKYNPITRIDGEALKGRKRVDLDFNPFDDFPWSYTVKGQKFSLDGVLIRCSCAMKDAIKREVVMLGQPRCIGHSESYDVVLWKLQCPAIRTKPYNDGNDRAANDRYVALGFLYIRAKVKAKAIIFFDLLPLTHRCSINIPIGNNVADRKRRCFRFCFRSNINAPLEPIHTEQKRMRTWNFRSDLRLLSMWIAVNWITSCWTS